LLQQGAPTEKLVLGLAMYGRTFILTTMPESPKINPIGLASLDIGFKGPYTSEEGFMGFNEVFNYMFIYLLCSPWYPFIDFIILKINNCPIVTIIIFKTCNNFSTKCMI